MALFEQIKAYLRVNPFYRKYCEVPVNNFRFMLRNMKYYRQLYGWKKDKEIEGHTIYFIIDPNIEHPGLVDRLNSIVCTYYIAKVNGFDFKIIFTNPFVLSDYLSVASQNWLASFDDLSYSIQNTRLLSYNGSGKVPKLNKNVKQYHVYCYKGYDILYENQIRDCYKVWSDLFNELFRPTPILEQALHAYADIQDKGFIAVHLRFVNALEQFENTYFNLLEQEQKENLIRRCVDAVRNIMNQYSGETVIVFSDSELFLNRIQKELPVIILDGKIGHISFNGSDEVVLKTFVDFYMIAKSKKTIRILGAEMYMSTFSRYAAISGGKINEDYYLN